MGRDCFHRNSKEQRMLCIFSSFHLSSQMRRFAGFDIAMQLKKGEVKGFLGNLVPVSWIRAGRAQWRLVPGYSHESLLGRPAVLRLKDASVVPRH